MSTNSFIQLDNLSKELLQGNVIFFIGSGFSQDSENNTSKRLIRRLMVRFNAITSILKDVKQEELEEPNSIDEIKKISKDLEETLKSTFDIKKKDSLVSEDSIKRLAMDYYQINDWMCSVFNILLEEMKKYKTKEDICQKISEKEKIILDSCMEKEKKLDNEPLKIIEWNKYETFFSLGSNMAGKALFLDTMGFDDPNIMRGKPFLSNITETLTSYQNRLLKRHHILARLAREGLSNPLITTNYDLLLEGAYRLAGFIYPDNGNKEKVKGCNVQVPYFNSIREAKDFFNYGDAQQTVLIAKIHGCVHRYRDMKSIQCDCEKTQTNTNVKDCWEKYLKSMVFTFREIQNWREDAWSRDYIQTLQRTHTIAFCGYSMADPVLHDTFRSVYEEMGKKRIENPSIMNLTEKIPAYFFGISDKKEFHGVEMLRSASKAVGKNTSLTDPPNYVHFHIEKDGIKKFPDLDESMLWLYHLTCRKIQYQCLENNLQQIIALLLGHPCPMNEFKVILNNFELLMNHEKKRAEVYDEKPENRDSFYSMTNWIEYFHIGLLKQFAFAQDNWSAQGLRNETGDKQSPYWYYPFMGNPGWTAWVTVLEIALRKMIISWQQDCDSKWYDISDTHRLTVIPSPTPSVSFLGGKELKTPILLEFKLRESRVQKNTFSPPGVFRKKITWLLNEEEIPWWKKRNKEFQRNIKIPDAKTLWLWASDAVTKDHVSDLDHFLEDKNE